MCVHAHSPVLLCNAMPCSLSGSSIHGIFQARILEWIAISSSRVLPGAGIEPVSPTLQTDSLPLSHQGSPTLAVFKRKKNFLRRALILNNCHINTYGKTNLRTQRCITVLGIPLIRFFFKLYLERKIMSTSNINFPSKSNPISSANFLKYSNSSNFPRKIS